MSLVDKAIDFIISELNIDINEENKKLVIDKFYPNIEDKLYWSYQIEYSFYEGVVNKKEYEKIKTLPPNTYIEFAEIEKYVVDECDLKNIPFTDDINKIKPFYDRGGIKGKDYFDLMNYFYEFEKLDYVEEEN